MNHFTCGVCLDEKAVGDAVLLPCCDPLQTRHHLQFCSHCILQLFFPTFITSATTSTTPSSATGNPTEVSEAETTSTTTTTTTTTSVRAEGKQASSPVLVLLDDNVIEDLIISCPACRAFLSLQRPTNRLSAQSNNHRSPADCENNDTTNCSRSHSDHSRSVQLYINPKGGRCNICRRLRVLVAPTADWMVNDNDEEEDAELVPTAAPFYPGRGLLRRNRPQQQQQPLEQHPNQPTINHADTTGSNVANAHGHQPQPQLQQQEAATAAAATSRTPLLLCRACKEKGERYSSDQQAEAYTALFWFLLRFSVVGFGVIFYVKWLLS